jgi:filamentous hemagglutinin
VRIAASASAGGKVTVRPDERLTVLATVVPGTELTVEGAGSGTILTELHAPDGLYASLNGSLTVLDDVSSEGKVTLRGGAGLLVFGQVTGAADVSLRTAGPAAVVGAVHAGGDLEAVAGTGLKLAAPMTAGGKMTLRGDFVAITAPVTADGELRLGGSGYENLVVAAPLRAGDALAATADSRLAVADMVVAGGPIQLSSQTVAAVTWVESDGGLAVDATEAAILSGDTRAANVALSGTRVIVNGVMAGGAISVAARDLAVFGPATQRASLDVSVRSDGRAPSSDPVILPVTAERGNPWPQWVWLPTMGMDHVLLWPFHRPGEEPLAVGIRRPEALWRPAPETVPPFAGADSLDPRAGHIRFETP